MSKVQLTDVRAVQEISLPSFPGSVLEIYGTLLVGDYEGIDTTKTDIENSIKTLPRLIKSWNFTDSAGADLPINADSLKLLPTEDLKFIVDQIEALATKQKKS